MHESYWGFSEAPFALTPDPRFFYVGNSTEETLMLLHYGITSNKGIVMLTGALGSGKTAMCHKLVSLLEPTKTQVVEVVNPKSESLTLHLHNALELTSKPKDRQAAASELKERLLDLYEKGKKLVLIIDGAHAIEKEVTFEELRALLNLQLDDQFLVNVVLCGLPQLSANLLKYEDLDQTIAIRERLQPLSLKETGEMILHRLRTAGYTGDPNLFDQDALLELHRFTKGVPRLVCHLADHALRLGKLHKEKCVDGMLMHESIDEFYGSENAA